MSSKRLYFLLIGIIFVLFIGLVVGTYGANNLLSTQANKLTNLKAKNLALTQEQLSLSNAKEDLKKYANFEQIAQDIVPEDKDQAETVLEIVNIAAQNGISLSSITFPASTLGTATSPQLSTTKPGVTSSSAANSELSSPTSPLNKLSQLEPVLNIPGVYELPITVQGDPNKPVDYSSFISFLNALEYNRRTAEISTITISPSANNPNLLSFNLTLDEYIKP